MTTLPPATCGAPVVPVCAGSQIADSQSRAPDAASMATSRQSPVPTNTRPSDTATPRLTRAAYEFCVLAPSWICGSNCHRIAPVAASTAYTRDSDEVTYITPSTTIGSDANPMGLTRSSDHASPSRPTLLS